MPRTNITKDGSDNVRLVESNAAAAAAGLRVAAAVGLRAACRRHHALSTGIRKTKRERQNCGV
jgi:hypothetical protein